MTSVIVRRGRSGLKIIIIIIVQTVPQYQNRPGNLVGALTLVLDVMLTSSLGGARINFPDILVIVASDALVAASGGTDVSGVASQLRASGRVLPPI